MKHLISYKKEHLVSLVKTRDGETKLGEKIAEHWQAPSVQFVLLGIEEDIGVRVNGGIGGTHTAWHNFLAAFVNIQNTDFLEGSKIGIYGHFNFDDLKENATSTTVELIDNEVVKAIFEICHAGKIPIIIGGGHNNAYPIIKGVSQAHQKAINTINLDAHSDFRRLEGRHSGNGFSYAHREGYLKKYAVIGLHQNYNAQLIINELAQNPHVSFCFWEDIFLKEKLTFTQAISDAIFFTKNDPTGIELDLDAIENISSSAMTPCGISATQARQYIHQVAQNVSATYLHICEGISLHPENGGHNLIGKFISYLVSDFMKAINSNS
jgi:formiminoglutamase